MKSATLIVLAAIGGAAAILPASAADQDALLKRGTYLVNGPVACGNCQNQVRAGAKFCDSCGTPMARHCTNCNADLTATAKFCAECGTPASPPAG